MEENENTVVDPLAGQMLPDEGLFGPGTPADAAAAERMLSALARSGIPVTAMARSPLSLTALVPEEKANAAAAALHKEFFET